VGDLNQPRYVLSPNGGAFGHRFTGRNHRGCCATVPCESTDYNLLMAAPLCSGTVCALRQGAPAIGVVGRSRELSWASDQLKSCIISEVVGCCVESSRYEVEPELASALRTGAFEAPWPEALLAAKLMLRNSAASCTPLARLARRARLFPVVCAWACGRVGIKPLE